MEANLEYLVCTENFNFLFNLHNPSRHHYYACFTNTKWKLRKSQVNTWKKWDSNLGLSNNKNTHERKDSFGEITKNSNIRENGL